MQSTALAQRKSLEFKKHVGLIHSTNKLSLLERKIANALLYNAYENLLVQEEHQMHIPSLCLLIGYNSKDYKTIRRSLVSLISTVLEWNLVDKDKDEEKSIWMASSMLADAKIEGPICTYSYSKRMRELCYYPEFYGRLNMMVLSQFKSTYGLALYENCVRYQNITQTPWFDLPTYRKLMGVEDGKYEVFRDLNRRVIKPSVQEVNSHASISVRPELKKRGRAVIAIRFLIARKQERITVDQLQIASQSKPLVSRLKENYGFSAKQAKELISQYSETYILEKIAIIESSASYQNGQIEYLAKYLQKALEEDYQAPKSSKTVVLEQRRQKEQVRQAQKNREEKQRAAYEHYARDSLQKFISTLSAQAHEELMLEFKADLQATNTMAHKWYQQHGFDHPGVRGCFNEFVRKMRQKEIGEILSYEEFCEQEY